MVVLFQTTGWREFVNNAVIAIRWTQRCPCQVRNGAEEKQEQQDKGYPLMLLSWSVHIIFGHLKIQYDYLYHIVSFSVKGNAAVYELFDSLKEDAYTCL